MASGTDDSTAASDDDGLESAALIPKTPADLKSGARQRRRLVLGCACNILNGTLGPGMLVLPLAFSRTGLLLGTALLLLDWAMSYLALRMLLDACAQMRVTNLVQLARAHGPRMSLFVDWSVVLYFYGTCVSYLILIGGTFDHLLHYYSDDRLSTPAPDLDGRALSVVVEASPSPPPPPPLPPVLPLSVELCSICEGNDTSTFHGAIMTVFQREALRDGARHELWRHAPDSGDALLSAFTLGIMLPLSCKTSLDAIGTVSTVVPVLYAYLCAALWTTRQKVTGAAATAAAAAAAQRRTWPVLQAIPTMVYCFSTQAVYLPALEGLHAQAHDRGATRHASAQARRLARRVTDATFAATLLLYLGCGVGGYLRAPGVPAPNVLDSFQPTGALLVAYVALVFALSLSFPVMFMVARAHPRLHGGPRSLSRGPTPPARLASTEAQAAPPDRKAPPEQLGRLRWPLRPAPGRPEDEDSRLPATGARVLARPRRAREEHLAHHRRAHRGRAGRGHRLPFGGRGARPARRHLLRVALLHHPRPPLPPARRRARRRRVARRAARAAGARPHPLRGARGAALDPRAAVGAARRARD